jgi:glyoxylase-like metal-dependent hydrolase (beta-lactamase superfamily II)
MTEATATTRRAVLAGAVTAALAPTAGTAPVRAAVRQSDKQAPGFYRYKVGTTEITAVTDGAFANPLTDKFIRNVKRDDVNKALEAVYLAKDQVTVPYTPIVVNTGSKLVVIDTGLGPALYEQRKGIVGQFHTNLAAAGIDRAAVDAVVISHFHGDHINGLVTTDNKPAFPNAEVLVPSGEWKFWNDAGEESKAAGNVLVEGNFKNIKRVFGALGNKVIPYEAGREVVPGITAMASYGHTPGHVSHVVSSGNASVMVQADVTNVPLFVQNPGWFIQFDMDPVAAEATRRRFYDMLVAEKMLVQGFHYPFPSLGHVERAGSGYRVIPVPWNPTI